ncbi:hypothetical protein ACFL4E_01840 [Candidatus Omnitrophota bacterium]
MKLEPVNFDDWTYGRKAYSPSSGEDIDFNISLFRNETESSVEKEIRERFRGKSINAYWKGRCCEVFDISQKKVSCFFRSVLGVDYVVNHALSRSLMAFQNVLGMIFLHAACIIVEGKASLFIAPSGGGKTTLSLLARDAGFKVLNDEYCVIKQKNGSFFTGVFPVNIGTEYADKVWEIEKIYFLRKSNRNEVSVILPTEAMKRSVPEALQHYRNTILDEHQIEDRKRVFGFLSSMFDTVDFKLLDFTKSTEVFKCLK